MWRDLINGGWRISDSWWKHAFGIAKYHITGNPEDDPLWRYVLDHPEEIAQAIYEHIF